MAMGKKVEIIARGSCVMEGKVLLCHTKGAENMYLPGGHVEFAESARTALEREISEEMDRKALAGRFLGVCEHTFLQKGKSHCEVNLVFEMEVAGADPKITPASMEDYIEFLWVPVDELRDAILEPDPLCDLLPLWMKPSFIGDRFATTFNPGDQRA